MHRGKLTVNFSPFIDQKPGVPKEERYKALGGLRYPEPDWGGWPSPDRRHELLQRYGPGGLRAFVSADGIHWRKLADLPVIPETFGKFDSQNGPAVQTAWKSNPSPGFHSRTEKRNPSSALTRKTDGS